MTQLHERLRYVNPVLVDDVTRGVVGYASRILQYERYLDHLESVKGIKGRLPLGVERNVGLSMSSVLADVKAAGCLMLDLVDELEGAGVLDVLPAHLARRLASRHEVEIDATLASASTVLETFVSERGLPVELWRWALPYVGIGKAKATFEGDALRVHDGAREVGSIVGAMSGFDLQSILGVARDAKTHALTPASAMRGTVQAAVDAYEARARRTATNGVQVLPTGILPIILIVLIVAFIVFVIGLTITVLCANGVIRDMTTCEVGVALLVVGLIGSLVFAAAGGRMNDDGQGLMDPRDPPA